MTLRTCRNWTHHRKSRLELTQVWAVTSLVAACLLGLSVTHVVGVSPLRMWWGFSPFASVKVRNMPSLSIMPSGLSALEHPGLRPTSWLRHARYNCFSVMSPPWLWLQVWSSPPGVLLRKDLSTSGLCSATSWGDTSSHGKKSQRLYLANGAWTIMREFNDNEQINLTFNY